MFEVGDCVLCINGFGSEAKGLKGYIYRINKSSFFTTVYVYFIKEFYGGHKGYNNMWPGKHCRNFPLKEIDNYLTKIPPLATINIV